MLTTSLMCEIIYDKLINQLINYKKAAYYNHIVKSINTVDI